MEIHVKSRKSLMLGTQNPHQFLSERNITKYSRATQSTLQIKVVPILRQVLNGQQLKCLIVLHFGQSKAESAYVRLLENSMIEIKRYEENAVADLCK